MHLNYLVLGLTALVPLLLGFVWYNPKVLGGVWMQAAGLQEDKMKEGFNMPLVFGLTLLFGFFLAFGLMPIVIHQMGLYSMLMNHMQEPETQKTYQDLMSLYGTEFRTFKHGALHGTITGIFIALPLIGINALFERKGFKYVLIHVGYWTVCLMLMGGIICQFA